MFFKIPAMQQYVLTERQLYTEFVQVMAKLQSNFGMHKLARLKNSVLEVFFLELYTFTMTSYSSQNKSIRIYSSRLNPFWQCLLSNSSAFSTECKSWIDNSVFSLIYTQLDENLNFHAIHSDE